jgi:ethylbenzene dioxygenase subunit beta
MAPLHGGGQLMPAAANHGAGVDLRPIEALLFHEARLLDEGRFAEWLELYTADATYWVPLERGQANPYETSSLIFDDRRLMEARIRQFSHPRHHSQTPPSRTCHFVGNVALLEQGGNGALCIASSLMVVEFRGERQRLFAGHCRHRLVATAGGYKIAAKRIDLINSEGVLDGISLLF